MNTDVKYPGTMDPNIKNLVEALNKIPGVRTFSSCEGHIGRDLKPSQCIYGEFSVCMTISRDEQGWSAIEFISWILFQFDMERDYDNKKTRIFPWINGDSFPANHADRPLAWSLDGGYDGKKELDFFAQLIIENLNII